MFERQAMQINSAHDWSLLNRFTKVAFGGTTCMSSVGGGCSRS
jgi:hypothetical protein